MSYHWKKKKSLNRKTWRLFFQRVSRAAVVFKEGGEIAFSGLSPGLVLIILTIKLKELKQSNGSEREMEKNEGARRFPLACNELAPPPLPFRIPQRSREVILGKLWRLNSSVAPWGLKDARTKGLEMVQRWMSDCAFNSQRFVFVVSGFYCSYNKLRCDRVMNEREFRSTWGLGNNTQLTLGTCSCFCAGMNTKKCQTLKSLYDTHVPLKHNQTGLMQRARWEEYSSYCCLCPQCLLFPWIREHFTSGRQEHICQVRIKSILFWQSINVFPIQVDFDKSGIIRFKQRTMACVQPSTTLWRITV